MSIVKGTVIPIRDNVLISEMEFGEERTKHGIIIQQLEGKLEGIKARWGKVWAIGPDQKDVKVGEWVCVDHGRWTRGVRVQSDNGDEIIIRRIDNKDILLVADQKPSDVQLGVGM